MNRRVDFEKEKAGKKRKILNASVQSSVTRLETMHMLRQRQYPFLFHFFYFLLVIALFEGLVLLSPRVGYDRLFGAGGLLERFQLICILSSGLILFILSRVYAFQASILSLLSLLAFMAAVREMSHEQFYRVLLLFPSLKWALSLGSIGIVLGIYRKQLLRQASLFLNLTASPVLMTGFLIVTGWSQVLGQKKLFHELQDARLVEESLESAGYLLILLGVLEVYLNLRNNVTITAPKRGNLISRILSDN